MVCTIIYIFLLLFVGLVGIVGYVGFVGLISHPQENRGKRPARHA